MMNLEESITYAGIHKWLFYKFGKAKYCSFNKNHKAKRYEWASKTKEYKRNISEYIQLCPSCHRKFDYTEHQRELVRKANLGNKNGAKKVVKLNKKGEIVKIYRTVKKVAEEMNKSSSSIVNLLKGRTKNKGKYLWKYL